jgi:hypothetical protein
VGKEETAAGPVALQFEKAEAGVIVLFLSRIIPIGLLVVVDQTAGNWE